MRLNSDILCPYDFWSQRSQIEAEINIQVRWMVSEYDDVHFAYPDVFSLFPVLKKYFLSPEPLFKIGYIYLSVKAALLIFLASNEQEGLGRRKREKIDSSDSRGKKYFPDSGSHPCLFLILCLSASFSFFLLPTVEGWDTQTHCSRNSPGWWNPMVFSWACLCSPGHLWVLLVLRELWSAHSNLTPQENLLCELSLDTEITMATELSGVALRGTINSWGHLLKIEAISRAI